MEEGNTTVDLPIDFSPNMHQPIPPGEVVIVPAVPAQEINRIHDRMNGEGHNLMLARETVEAAIKSRKLKPKDLEGKYFPDTTIPLSDLLNPNSIFHSADLDQIEDQLIDPLREIFNKLFKEFIEKENKKDEVIEEPKNYTKLSFERLLNMLKKREDTSFADFGATWLKEKVKPEETSEKLNFITAIARKVGLK